MRWVALAFLAGAACSTEDTLWVTPPPGRIGERSLVLLFEAPDLPTFAVATELTDGALAGPIRLDASPWANEAVEAPIATAYFYPHSLGELAVGPGVLPETSQPRLCALGAPDAIASGEVGEGEPTRWTLSGAEMSALHRSFLVADDAAPCALPNLCRTVTSRSLTMPGIGNVRFILELEPDRALVGSTNPPSIAYVTRTEVIEAVELDGRPSESGYLEPDGELWLGGDQGRVERGRIGGAFEQIPIAEARSSIVSAISIRQSPRLVLAVAGFKADQDDPQPWPPTKIAVFAFEAPSWRKLYESEVDEFDVRGSSVVWTDTDKALIPFGSKEVLHFENGSITHKAPITRDLLLDTQVASLAVHPTLGLHFGGSNGLLYRYEPAIDDFLRVDSVVLLSHIDAIVPYKEGMIVGGNSGNMQQYMPGSAPCRERFGAGSDVNRMLRLGDDILVSGNNINRQGPNNVTWLFPR